MLTLEELPGHLEIRALLKKFVEEKTVPQVLLFSGPEGVGKKLYAHLFARALLGREEPFDLTVFTPQGRAYVHSVESIRTYIESTMLPPTEGKYKIFLFEEAEKMLPISSNCLLKTLEEAPPFVITLLITSAPHLILPTIRSRSFELSFSFLAKEELLALESHPISPLFTQGILTQPKERMTEEQKQCVDMFFQAALYYIHRDFLKGEESLSSLESLLAQKEKKEAATFFDLSLYFWRDLYHMRLSTSYPSLFFQERREEIAACSHLFLSSFEQVQRVVEDAKSAFQLGVGFFACVEALLLSLGRSLNDRESFLVPQDEVASSVERK